MTTLQLGIFASGRGSNFAAIYDAIQSGRLSAEIKLLLVNKPDAGALEFAGKHNIPAAVISRSGFEERSEFVKTLLSTLKTHGVEFIALAGYMKKMPQEVIQAFRHRIFNIHPALLPDFGGKGMYGHRVHEAVLEEGRKETGVTVHIVDEIYDHGPIVAQRRVPVESGDTPGSLAAKVLRLEHQIFAETLQLFAEERVKITGREVVIHPEKTNPFNKTIH